MKSIPEWSPDRTAGFPWEEFFRTYWQKSPVVVRGFAADYPELSADELAGFGLEEDTETRLVELVDGAYRLTQGPFASNTLENLRASNPWTILVQGVDQWLSEFALLREQYLKLPAWRLDDIMVSLATPGGGVGPHTDEYDVFLIQAQGKRRWSISLQPLAAPLHREDCDIKVLKTFEPDAESVLGPGDLLYLPPGVGHDGVAETECMTYSIGFFAPNRSTLMTQLGSALELPEALDTRFQDPWRMPTATPYELEANDLVMLQNWLHEATPNLTVNPQLLGEALTQPRMTAPQFVGDKAIDFNRWRQLQKSNESLIRDGSGRFLYFYDQNNQSTLLFANGRTWQFHGDLRSHLARFFKQMIWPCADLPLSKGKEPLIEFYIESLREGLLQVLD